MVRPTPNNQPKQHSLNYTYRYGAIKGMVPPQEIRDSRQNPLGDGCFAGHILVLAKPATELKKGLGIRRVWTPSF